MFTDEQIAALTKLADNIIAENKEIDSRNKAVDEHTAKLGVLNEAVKKLAEKHGVSTDTFQLQPQVQEAAPDQKAFDDFSTEVASLAKEHGLDDFNVQKIE